MAYWLQKHTKKNQTILGTINLGSRLSLSLIIKLFVYYNNYSLSIIVVYRAAVDLTNYMPRLSLANRGKNRHKRKNPTDHLVRHRDRPTTLIN